MFARKCWSAAGAISSEKGLWRRFVLSTPAAHLSRLRSRVPVYRATTNIGSTTASSPPLPAGNVGAGGRRRRVLLSAVASFFVLGAIWSDAAGRVVALAIPLGSYDLLRR